MNNKTENNGKRTITVDRAERKMRELFQKYEDEVLEEAMYNLVTTVLDKQPELLGSENGFHNFAVNFSKRDDSEVACEIVERGLLLFPDSTDLLADYLQMGSECGKFDRCEECYNKLMSIEYSTWTWRAYSFSIDYLIVLSSGVGGIKDLDELKNKALEIAKQYRIHMPNNEGSYCSEADIYSKFHQYDMKISALKNGIEKCDFSPKCSLRYADILIDEGNYDEAIKVIEKLLGMISSQESVNMAYVYYISGICKYALMMRNKDFSKEAVNSIYCDFLIAMDNGLGSDSYRINASKCIKVIERKSLIQYPEDYPDKIHNTNK